MAQTLTEKGFKNAKALIGGFNAWSAAGFPVEARNAPVADVKPAAAATETQPAKDKPAKKRRRGRA
ncbi:MAG: rhodanese-like domain-containing protein [Blastocatellia bacterium]